VPWFSHLQPAAGGNWNGVDSKGIPRDMSEMRAVRSLSGSNIIETNDNSYLQDT